MSVVLTRLLVSWAPRLRFIDVPNARSSHVKPTPRGGGLAIVVSFCATLLLAAALGQVDWQDVAGLIVPALVIAVVGLLDDRYGVPPAWRLVLHLAVGAGFLFATGGVPSTGIQWLDSNPGIGMAIATLAIAWSINFFNFMDGIDGIAGSEACFVAAGLALVAAVTGQGAVLVVATLLGTSILGFLVWNWPPARIFMGDVGSGFLGFVLAATGILALRSGAVGVWTVLILPGVFLADATVTLVRRALSGQSLHEAHRSHAYQWLARRWGGHAQVTLATIGLNLFVALPAAVLAWRNPAWAAPICGAVLCLFTLLAAIAGAGRTE